MMNQHNISIDLADFLLTEYDRKNQQLVMSAAPLGKGGDDPAPWLAKTRRKVVRGTYGDASITRKFWRERHAWKVHYETIVESDSFRMVIDDWAEWDVTPDKPLGWTKYIDNKLGSIWDKAIGDEKELSLAGDLCGFARWMDFGAREVKEFASIMEESGDIDEHEATLLVLSGK